MEVWSDGADIDPDILGHGGPPPSFKRVGNRSFLRKTERSSVPPYLYQPSLVAHSSYFGWAA